MNTSLNTEQKQILSHKMVQSAEILQMSSTQLEEYLNNQALENPVLELTEKQPEVSDDREQEKYQWISSHDDQNRYLYQKLEAGEEDGPERYGDRDSGESLADHLWSQLLTKRWPKRLEKPLRFLLASLDSRGYFTDSLEELAQRFGMGANEASELLTLVQSLEPAGVGARSLEECLCLQLLRQNRLTPELRDFIRFHLPKLAKNQLPAIAASMKLSMEEVKELCKIVRELNPRPGSLFSDARRLSYIIPDVVVVKFKGHFDILLNESLYPDISLNREYVKMFTEAPEGEVKEYLTNKIRQVQWLRQCISQRNSTLLSVVQAIITLQQDFFYRGPDFRKPLRLSDAAELLGIHESTVSRAVRSKYLQCSFGIFTLSSFFARAPVRQEDSGELPQPKATVLDVKRALHEIVDSEDKRKPLSDRILAERLAEKGFPISRRTVAKYRSEDGIPGASCRKEY